MSNQLDFVDELLTESKKKRKKRKKNVQAILGRFYGVPGQPSAATNPSGKYGNGPTNSPASGAYPGAGGKNSPDVPRTDPNSGMGPSTVVAEKSYQVQGDGVIVNKPMTADEFNAKIKKMKSLSFVNDAKTKTRYETFSDAGQNFHVFSLETQSGDPRHGINVSQAKIVQIGAFKTLDGAKSFIDDLINPKRSIVPVSPSQAQASA